MKHIKIILIGFLFQLVNLHSMIRHHLFVQIQVLFLNYRLTLILHNYH